MGGAVPPVAPLRADTTVLYFPQHQRLTRPYFINSRDEDIRDSQPYLNIMGSFHALHAISSQVCVLHSFVPVTTHPAIQLVGMSFSQGI